MFFLKDGILISLTISKVFMKSFHFCSARSELESLPHLLQTCLIIHLVTVLAVEAAEQNPCEHGSTVGHDPRTCGRQLFDCLHSESRLWSLVWSAPETPLLPFDNQNAAPNPAFCPALCPIHPLQSTPQSFSCLLLVTHFGLCRCWIASSKLVRRVQHCCYWTWTTLGYQQLFSYCWLEFGRAINKTAALSTP